jgi:hypothetical protein
MPSLAPFGQAVSEEKFYTKSLPFYSCSHTFIKKVRVMVFNATYNNISVISWQSFLLVEETNLAKLFQRRRFF